jgi:hypothetical protein
VESLFGLGSLSPSSSIAPTEIPAFLLDDDEELTSDSALRPRAWTDVPGLLPDNYDQESFSSPAAPVRRAGSERAGSDVSALLLENEGRFASDAPALWISDESIQQWLGETTTLSGEMFERALPPIGASHLSFASLLTQVPAQPHVRD